MTIGIAKNTSIIGIMQEVTEGTYVAPAAATDYIQPLADGFDLGMTKERVERNILTSSIGKVTSRVGQSSVTASLPVEFRASGVEGEKTDFDLLIKGCLGNSRQVTTQTTSKAAVNTTTLLNLEDADATKFNVGDVIIILAAGAHHLCAVVSRVTTPGSVSITVTPPAAALFPSGVVVSKTTTYYPANSGHIPLSLSYYWANEILQKAIGCKVTTMSIDSFAVGQLANFGFNLEGLSFDELNGSAPHTPTYDTGLPPLILNACIFQDGVEITVNTFALSVQNTLGFITSTCSSNGKISSRVTERVLSGTINPYKDDTSVAQYTRFNTNAPFTLFVRAFNPSAVAGEITLGSAIGIYLPNCLITEKAIGDQDGILTDELSFEATRGTAGTTEEMYMGFI